MIVSKQHRFIFIKTAKTAGTSMIIAFSQFCGSGDIITPLSRAERKRWADNMSTVPASLATRWQAKKLALWRFLRERSSGVHIPKNLSAELAREYLGEEIWRNSFKFCFERNPFDRAISLYYWHTRQNQVRPEINTYLQSLSSTKLSNWGRYTIKDKIALDFVGRYENLEQELHSIASKLNFPRLILPGAKSKARDNFQHYSRLLNQQSRLCIEKACAREIEIFGYQWSHQ